MGNFISLEVKKYTYKTTLKAKRATSIDRFFIYINLIIITQQNCRAELFVNELAQQFFMG